MRAKPNRRGAPGVSKNPTHRKRITVGLKAYQLRRRTALEILDRLERDGCVFLDEQPKADSHENPNPLSCRNGKYRLYRALLHR
jgi:hypothetical protein